MGTEILSGQRTLDQKRAEQAWQDVSSISGKDIEGNYRSLARGFSTDIQISGLGQSLAFLCAKNKAEHRALYNHVGSWLKKRLGITSDLLEWVSISATVDEYRFATSEVMAYLNWIKRFAEAKLKENK